jgi:septal ring factor EnvC (AmiA/AmiB activator)
MALLRSAALLTAVLVCAVPQPSCAQEVAPDVDISGKRSDLDDLKRRIRDLQRDLEKTEADRSSAVSAVAEAEREVSKAERALRKLVTERTAVQRQLTLIEGEQREAEIRIRMRQDELAGWLRRHYMYGSADVVSLLSARDPNELARDAHYLEILGRARLVLVDGLRTDLKLKAERGAEVAARRVELGRLEEEQRQQRVKLLATHAQRREALSGISVQLKSQQAAVEALKSDEARLAKVIATLVLRAREAAARQARLEAERRSAQGGKITLPGEGAVRRFGEGNFSLARGQLRLPVQGELAGRFGGQRTGIGTTWKGLFIRAATGAEVHAVSAGEVVFSDWMRGYGNLLIVDHGDNYLSVYGNNDVLYKEVGNLVSAGDVIAAVGAGGVEPESGLYFEIRHQGEVIDPLQWVQSR